MTAMRSMMGAVLASTMAFIWAPAPAAAQTGSSKAPSVLNAEVNSLWPDQNNGQITPLGARQTLLDIIASNLNTAGVVPYFGGVGGSLKAANLNQTNTDIPIAITSPSTNYRISELLVSNCSGAVTTATAGLFTSTGGAGTLFANQALSAITSSSANTAGNMTAMSATNTPWLNLNTLYLRVGTAQGG